MALDRFSHDVADMDRFSHDVAHMDRFSHDVAHIKLSFNTRYP